MSAAARVASRRLVPMSRRERNRRRRLRGSSSKRPLVLMAIVVVCGAGLGVLGAIGWVVAIAGSAPNLSDLKPRDPRPLSEVFASDGTLLGYIHADTVFQSVPNNRIPDTLKGATVAIEDRRFFRHGALDYQRIIRAGMKDLFGSGNSLQGASTLTMQLVDTKHIPKDVA